MLRFACGVLMDGKSRNLDFCNYLLEGHRQYRSETRVQFHQDQIHFLVVHETQLAIHETTKLDCIKQWAPRESAAPISHAMFSCDSQLVYASFLDGTVCIFTAAHLRLRCRINPSTYLPSSFKCAPACDCFTSTRAKSVCIRSVRWFSSCIRAPRV